MAGYVLIESRDPFESNDVAYCYELATSLAGAGQPVTLFLVQNGVLPARPGGRTPALEALARAGVRVRLVDRSDFPRDKLCGDTLNPGALAILDRLGLSAAVRRQALVITGMDVTGPGSAHVAADYPGGFTGAAILRRVVVPGRVHVRAYVSAEGHVLVRPA